MAAIVRILEPGFRISSGFRPLASVGILGRGVRIVLKLLWLAQVTPLIRLEHVFPGIGWLHVSVIVAQCGEDASSCCSHLPASPKNHFCWKSSDGLTTSSSCSADTSEPIREASPKTWTIPQSGTFRRRRNIHAANSQLPASTESDFSRGVISSALFVVWPCIFQCILSRCISKSSFALLLTVATAATPGIHPWPGKLVNAISQPSLATIP